MIFASLPGYRVIVWKLGEDGSENPPAFLEFCEYAILAWRTTNEGLVPVCENEIAVWAMSALPEGQYGVVMPDGSVSHLEYPSDSLATFKGWTEAAFRAGELNFDSDRDRANYAKRSPAAARHYASCLRMALQLPGRANNPAEVARLKRLYPDGEAATRMMAADPLAA
jgi:hypothetical protein